MPAIYRLICSHCGYEAEIMDHLTLYDDTSFVPLSHPGEEYDMEKLGYSERQAYLEGRVFASYYTVCKDCKSVVTGRAILFPHIWTFRTFSLKHEKWVIASIIVPVMIAGLWLDSDSPWIALLLAVALLVILEALRTKIDKRRALRMTQQAKAASNRRISLTNNRCSVCSGNQLVDYSMYLDENPDAQNPAKPGLRCPHCDHLELHDDPKCTMVA